MEQDIKRWIEGLKNNSMSIQTYWCDSNGVAQYKQLSAPEWTEVYNYISKLESGIVQLVFKQMELERKP